MPRGLRKLLLAAALATAPAAPAAAQGEGGWTYILVSDGTLGWDPADVVRHPDGRLSVKVMVFRNTPQAIPAEATHSAKSSGPGQTYDFENQFATYTCTGNSFVYDGGMLFAVADGHVKHVADIAPRRKVLAISPFDDMIRNHVCRRVKPADSSEATSLEELINLALAHRKRSG